MPNVFLFTSLNQTWLYSVCKEKWKENQKLWLTLLFMNMYLIWKKYVYESFFFGVPLFFSPEMPVARVRRTSPVTIPCPPVTTKHKELKYQLLLIKNTNQTQLNQVSVLSLLYCAHSSNAAFILSIVHWKHTEPVSYCARSVFSASASVCSLVSLKS